MSFDTQTRNRLANFVGKCRSLLCGDFKTPGGEMARLLAHYGIQEDGKAFDLDTLTHLDESERETARTLRQLLEHKRANAPKGKVWGKFDPAVYDLLQEQGFTVLNRLCALRMAEERGLILPSVGKGLQSDAFQLYDFHTGKSNPEFTPERRYQHFLYSIFDELSLDLGSLFDRFSPQGLLFPQPTALEHLLEELNHPDLAALWAEDETIGWIYQYWNSKEERKSMRDASAAPRNSRELAVRNQFFTPRYVVEFLTDNTLGRIWYEMTKGETRLKEQCRYLVRRPTEIFLLPIENAYRGVYGQSAKVPEDISSYDAFAALYDGDTEPAISGKDGFFGLAGGALSAESFYSHTGEKWEEHGNESVDKLRQSILDGTPHPKKEDLIWVWAAVAQYIENSQIGSPYCFEANQKLEEYFRKILQDSFADKSSSQEELLKQPVLIPHRPIKDPREIRLLDPACGSMHFGLYAFDLFEAIYEEAWDLPIIGDRLKEEFRDSENYKRQIPRLIIEHNIHGVDIDPRAVQIAGLSLWLRAQKSWLDTPATERPRVLRSNIVCAEPMPGNEDMLEDFCDTLQPPLLRDLVKEVFDKMKLAGEAGTLLKIEEEIREAVESSRRLWQKMQDQPKELFDPEEMGQISSQQELRLQAGLKPIKADFFDTAEERIYAALRDYAESAHTGDYQRRLFAEDAAHGFAFIDLCRKRYDAVVMNPPFGDGSNASKNYIKNTYPKSFYDLFGSFVMRGANLCTENGATGAITSRTGFFLSRMESWRRSLAFGHSRLSLMADLGQGVLDSAMVETAAYVVVNGLPVTIPMTFFGLLDIEDKGHALSSALDSTTSERRFDLRGEELEGLPGAPLAYWPAPSLRAQYIRHSSFTGKGGEIKQGLASGDDYRFLRSFWEVPANDSGRGARWLPFAKGGSYQRYYYDLDLVVDWSPGAQETYRLRTTQFPVMLTSNADKYCYKRALTYPQRTQKGFNVRQLPADALFGAKGPAIFPPVGAELLYSLGLFNTEIAEKLIQMLTCFGSYNEGYVSQVPFPIPGSETQAQVSALVRKQIQTIQCEYASDELAHDFYSTVLVREQQTDTREAIGLKLEKIFEQIFQGEEINEETESSYKDPIHFSVQFEPERSEENISYFVGAAFGRWDIRYATGELQPPELPDPFDPLPVCPPGMLQNADGLPAAPADVPDDYPLPITWPGILISDPGHPEDIVARVRDALAVIWGDRSAAIEQEACEILGIRTLRDYFAEKKSGGKFFKDHLKRYSKSRRQAPIYWPLSTESGTYTLWVYYHRLNEDTLYACITNFVAPKQEEVRKTLDQLLAKGDARTKAEDKEYEQTEALVGELATFRAELELLAKVWKPNLNDGAQITAAPLWSLFRLKPWQKKLKDTWQKLEAGEYDWAHLAHSMWPERVIPKCIKDRSLAIAHGYEEALWEEVEKSKDKWVWQPKTNAAEIAAKLVAGASK